MQRVKSGPNNNDQADWSKNHSNYEKYFVKKFKHDMVNKYKLDLKW